MTNIHTASNKARKDAGNQAMKDASKILKKNKLTYQQDPQNKACNIYLTQSPKGQDLAILPHNSLKDRSAKARELGETLKIQHEGITVIAAIEKNKYDNPEKIEKASKGKIDKVVWMDSLSDLIKQL